MRLILKSDQYYDFYRLKTVKITDNDFLEIVGNFGKGKRSKKINLRISMVDDINWKRFKRYLDNYKKMLIFDGLCPYCESENIWKIQEVVRREKVNDPKHTKRETEVKTINYICENCKKYFEKERAIYCDITIYY